MFFFFFPMYVSGTGTLGNVQILSLTVLHSPNIKVNSAIQCLQLVFLKSKNDESPAVYVHKFTGSGTIRTKNSSSWDDSTGTVFYFQKVKNEFLRLFSSF